MLKVSVFAAIFACIANSTAQAQSASANVINACVDSKTGTVRIVELLTQCNAKESPLSWTRATQVYHTALQNNKPLPQNQIVRLDNLPAGNYQIHAMARLVSFTVTSAPKVGCNVTVFPQAGGEITVGTSTAKFHEITTTLALTGLYKAAGPFSATLDCGYERPQDFQSGAGVEAYRDYTFLMLNKVGDVLP